AQYQMGIALRSGPLHRPRARRIRRGVGSFRTHPRSDQHAASSRRNSLQRIQLRRRLRGRIALKRVGRNHASAQEISGMETGMSIEVQHVRKVFGTHEALKDVSLRIETGELMALLGPSGSGKTTLLRIIAGLDLADSGTVHLHDEDATRSTARDRQVGFVFQHYALFRHMTVFENIAFGLRVRPKSTRPTERDIHLRVLYLLKLIQLDWLAYRYPSQLSGGQRQRVALARALAVEPRVLLLDEPCGALDAKGRRELRQWLRRLHDDLHIASVFVTHDQEEALEVADRVAILSDGNIEQVGTPDEVYRRPANAFVKEFLRDVNPGRLAVG